MAKRSGKILQFVAIAVVFIALAVLLHKYGMAPIRANVERMGVWAPLGLFALRFSSVLVPALPGTAYSLAAGALLGFPKGLAVVCLWMKVSDSGADNIFWACVAVVSMK